MNGEQNQQERLILTKLITMEYVAEKKAKIYSRLLTDTALAKAMEALSARHTERKQRLTALMQGKTNSKNSEKGEASEK